MIWYDFPQARAISMSWDLFLSWNKWGMYPKSKAILMSWNEFDLDQSLSWKSMKTLELTQIQGYLDGENDDQPWLPNLWDHNCHGRKVVGDSFWILS